MKKLFQNRVSLSRDAIFCATNLDPKNRIQTAATNLAADEVFKPKQSEFPKDIILSRCFVILDCS